MKIKIKKKNRGKFTKAAKAAGESVQEYLKQEKFIQKKILKEHLNI